MSELIRATRLLWVPLLLIAGMQISLPYLNQLSPTWKELLPWLPYLLVVLVGLLSWHFNLSRSAIAAAYVFFTALWLQTPFHQSDIYQQLILALLPINLLLLSYLPERPLLSSGGLLPLLLVALQLAGAWLLENQFPQFINHWLQYLPTLTVDFSISPLLNDYLPQYVASLGDRIRFSLPYTIPIIAITFATMLWILIKALRSQQRFDSHLLIIGLLLSGLLIQTAIFKNPPLEHNLWISLNLLFCLITILSQSHDMAYIDELTAIPGRRALNQQLAILGRRHTIAMADIDHFKRFNDTYGHDIGDQVLKLVASKLSQVQGGGKAYRYGGEEFCILFPGKHRDQSLAALEQVRQTIEQTQLKIRSDKRPDSNKSGREMRGKYNTSLSKNVSVTISIGVAQRQAKTDTLKQADKALYKAKKQGRNCICY